MTWLMDPDPLLQVVAVALATWATAVTLIYKGGPGNVILLLRKRLGVVHDEDGAPAGIPDTWPGSVFGCVWCMSLWTTPVLYGILWAAPYVVVGIATWGAAMLLESFRPKG